MVKKLLLVVAAVLVLLVAVAAGTLLFVDANRFRPTLESQLSTALGRRVTLGSIRLSILSGGVSVQNVSIGDNPAFSNAPFVTAKSLDVGVALIPLVFSRTLHVESFRLDEPRVVLLRRASTWNFSNLTAPASEARAPAPSTPAPRSDLSVKTLTISHGEVVIGALGEAGRNRVYRDVTIEASDLSFASAFPFRMSAKTPGDGSLDLKGNAGPLSEGAIDETPVHAEVALRHFDVAASGLVDPRAGVAGIVEFTGDLTSDGRHAHSKGTLRVDKLQLIPGSTPSRVPIEMAYELEHDLKNQSGALMRGDVHIGKAVARLSGTYSTRGETPTTKMTLDGKRMAVQELEASLPAFGITLPAGASLQGGTMDVGASIAGRIDKLVIAGPIRVSDTKLRSFDLAGKMATIAALAGVPRNADTVIETLAAALRIAPDGIQANEIQLVVPSIGTLTGSGTISPSHALNFKLVAQPKDNSLLGSVSRVAALGHPENGIPFHVGGTTENPVFAPDIAATAGNAVKSSGTQAASGLLKKLFKK